MLPLEGLNVVALPGALARLCFAPEKLVERHPRLIVCSNSGYGEDGLMARRKAYDLLIQAESGLASPTAGPEAAAHVGISIVDIAADVAFEGVNDMAALLDHPHLRRISVDTPAGPVRIPAPAQRTMDTTRENGPVPALGRHNHGDTA